MEDLRDKVFQIHNEITIRDGRTLYVIDGHMAVGKNLVWVGYADYDYQLKVNSDESNYCDIMKVYNPIKKEIIYDRDDVDWSKVKVDTPILVSDNNIGWTRGYFAKYEGGRIYTFYDGSTSWSASNKEPCGWRYAKLADK